MARKTKAPAKAPAKRTPAKKPATVAPMVEPDGQPEQAAVKTVVPLSRGALQVLLQLIDNSTIQGKDMEPVMMAKQELIRVAGLRNDG